jgi:hypothetical protein
MVINCILFVCVFVDKHLSVCVKYFHVLVGVLMKYENCSIRQSTCSVLQFVIVTVSVSDIMFCSILSARTPLYMMPTIEACHNVCV